MVISPAEVLRKKTEAGAISPAEAGILRSYLFEVQSARGIQADTARTKTHMLCRALTPLHEAGATLDAITTDTALAAVASIRQSGKKQNYKKAIIGEFKALLLWMIEEGHPDLNLMKIQKVKVPSMNWRTKTAADLPTKDQILTLIAACENSRDRALLSILYDGSNRPIELRKLTWGDITLDQYGARFRTSCKTGFERRIRLTFSLPYLAAWKNDYPEEITPDAPVFVTLRKYRGPDGRRRHLPITNSAVDYLVGRLKKKTGIDFHAYLMRHARISHDLEDGYDQSYIMLKNWGHLKASMLAIYGNPRAEILEQEALAKAGLITPEDRQPREEPIQSHQCPVCFETNAPTHACCSSCGAPLTERARAAQEQKTASILDAMNKDPRLALIDRKLEEFRRSLIADLDEPTA